MTDELKNGDTTLVVFLWGFGCSCTVKTVAPKKLAKKKAKAFKL